LLAFADLMPWITARKSYKAREKLVDGLKEYIARGHHEQGSALTRGRTKIAQKYGMSPDGVARSELSFLFAGITNTAITTYWMIVHVFARPELLRDVREEIGRCKKGNDLDVQRLASDCPLLLSVYRETLRLRSDNSSNRLVTAPTLLANAYQLAEGSVVQISGAAMHNDGAIWGENVDVFDAYRFMPERLKEKAVHPSAFRAFGGGTTICPGRHFATREILYFVALVIDMFDIEAIGSSVLTVPKAKDNVLPVHILEPKTKLPVRFLLRNKR
jgi:cytochrome P450